MPPRIGSLAISSPTTSLESQVGRIALVLLNPTTQSSCSFSTTASRNKTSKLRRDMYAWFKRTGHQYEQPSSPSYVGGLQDQPFPMNPLFRSQPVLDEQAREIIYQKVVLANESLKAVSAELGVDIRRVAAVVRLKTIEKQWASEGKPLARAYSKAVLKMLPKTSYYPGKAAQPHEPINELHVHKFTMQQLFLPTAESREFTREDAAKAFHERMLSADVRSPHPQLIQLEKDIQDGMAPAQGVEKFKVAVEKESEALKMKTERLAAREEARMTKVNTGRFEFRFKNINADDVGEDGRSRKAVGWRYGVPFYDRKRGQVKIPTSVP